MEKKKHVAPFVVGLVGSIFGVLGGLCATVCASVCSAALAAVGANKLATHIIVITLLLTLGGAIVGLVGSCLSMKRAMVGAILMVIGAVCNIASLFCVPFSFFVLVSGVMLGVGSLLAFLAASKDKKSE